MQPPPCRNAAPCPPLLPLTPRPTAPASRDTQFVLEMARARENRILTQVRAVGAPGVWPGTYPGKGAAAAHCLPYMPTAAHRHAMCSTQLLVCVDRTGCQPAVTHAYWMCPLLAAHTGRQCLGGPCAPHAVLALGGKAAPQQPLHSRPVAPRPHLAVPSLPPACSLSPSRPTSTGCWSRPPPPTPAGGRSWPPPPPACSTASSCWACSASCAWPTCCTSGRAGQGPESADASRRAGLHDTAVVGGLVACMHPSTGPG